MLRQLPLPATRLAARRLAPSLSSSVAYLAPRSTSGAAGQTGRGSWSDGASSGAAPALRMFSSSTRWLAETVKVPEMAESISEGTLKQWLKKPGDFVKVDEEIATIETDKIDISVNAPKSGTITETLAEEEDTVTVGQDLFRMELGDAPSGEASSSSSGEGAKAEDKAPVQSESEAKSEDPQPQPAESAPSESQTPSKTSSDTRKKSKADEVLEKREPKRETPESKATAARQPEARKDFGKSDKFSEKETKAKPGDRTERRVKMNRMRIRISERLKQSQNTAASLTTFNEIDMSSLMEMRKLYKDSVYKEHGVKLGFMSAFAKAACLALKEIPAANASIEGDGPGDTVVYRDYVDLSVAVATPKGLVTPVVRNAEGMNFVDIESEIAGLGKKARDGKLTLEDMAGGSFTISNGGVFGSLYGTPIINLPQTAVLGMHTIKDTPVVRNGEIVIRPIMVVALTYDHRLLDGREAVTFLVKIKEYIEDPRKMLLA